MNCICLVQHIGFRNFSSLSFFILLYLFLALLPFDHCLVAVPFISFLGLLISSAAPRLSLSLRLHHCHLSPDSFIIDSTEPLVMLLHTLWNLVSQFMLLKNLFIVVRFPPLLLLLAFDRAPP